MGGDDRVANVAAHRTETGVVAVGVSGLEAVSEGAVRQVVQAEADVRIVIALAVGAVLGATTVGGDGADSRTRI